MAKKQVIISGGFTIKGDFIHNGLDTSTLVNVIVLSREEKFLERLTFPPNLCCIHELTVKETHGVLINEHKFSSKESREFIDKITEKLNLRVVRRTEGHEYYEEIVEKANTKTVKNNPRWKIGDHDIIILAGFLKENINILHSGDQGMIETAKELKFEIMELEREYINKENELKKP